MRVMVFVPGDESSEAGKMPSQELIEKMTKFNEELVKAGVMLDGQGLTPTSKAKRVKFSGAKRTVTDGPYPEAIGGFWVVDVPSREDALEWAAKTAVACRCAQEVRGFMPTPPWETDEARAFVVCASVLSPERS